MRRVCVGLVLAVAASLLVLLGAAVEPAQACRPMRTSPNACAAFYEERPPRACPGKRKGVRAAAKSRGRCAGRGQGRRA